MANRIISDLLGTALSKFQLGIDSGALLLKAVSSKIRVRNKADSADAPFVASKVSSSGDSIGLNEDAAGSAADWTMDIQRPTSGMSEARTIILPAGNPAVGQALYVSAYAGGTVTLDYLTIAAGSDKPVIDTTTVAFGASSPVAMFTKPANAVTLHIWAVVDTAFDGVSPTASIGITGTTSKYMSSTELDLTTLGTYEVFRADVATVGGTENIIATLSAGGSTAGSVRFLYEYVIPS